MEFTPLYVKTSIILVDSYFIFVLFSENLKSMWAFYSQVGSPCLLPINSGFITDQKNVF